MLAVKAVTELKAHMPRVLKDLQDERQPLLIVSNGQAQAVLQDIKSYQETQDAISLLKMMVQSEKSINADQGSSTEDVMKRLRERVQARKA